MHLARHFCELDRALSILILLCYCFTYSNAQSVEKHQKTQALWVDTDFIGGNAELISVDHEKNEISFAPESDPKFGWQAWWYFKIDRAYPGDTLTLRVYGGTYSSGGSWAWMKRAVYSYDDENWFHTSPGKKEIDNGIYHTVYRQEIDHPTVWFAFALPYTPPHVRQLTRDISEKTGYLEPFILAWSREDRPIYGMRITGPDSKNKESRKSGIWIQARQHAFESGSSWVADGFVRWLCSDDPDAAFVRKHAVVAVIPIMDVDGTVKGQSGKMQQPQDHNRDWTDKPYWPAVSAAQNKIRELIKEDQLDVFVDIHGPGRAVPYFFLRPDFENYKGIRAKTFDDFLRAFSAEKWDSENPLCRQPSSDLMFYDLAKPQWGDDYSMAWVLKNSSEEVVAVTLEVSMDTALSHREGYYRQGGSFGKHIANYLRIKLAEKKGQK